MAIDPRTTVGDLVIARPTRIPVLESFGVDYCCGGDQSLDAACKAAEVDSAVVIAALDAADAASDTRAAEPTTDWQVAPLRDLIADIVGKHHEFLRRELPRLGDLMAKVQTAHGANHPELDEVAACFAQLRGELEQHLQKEEGVLFPMIEEMEITRSVADAHCGSVANPIGVMEHEHDGAGEALRRLRTLTRDYTPPADACPTYHGLLAGLAELERDLHLHIHKENNLLHPRAIALESSLTSAHGG